MEEDNDIWLTTDELEAESRNFPAAQRRKYADSGVALPDGSFPIPDKDALRRAIRLVGRGKNPAAAKRHIVKRAKALGAVGMLPDTWGVAAENENDEMTFELPDTFQSFLVLDGKSVPKPLILEQTEEEKATKPDTLKVKMPFFIGESIVRAPQIPRRVYFPSSLLSETVKEGKKQISLGQQPLTVYARHAHALADDHLPIGAIVDLEQEGNIGYVTLEIEPTTYGKDAQILLKANPPKLNAVSLRSGPKRFELEEVQVNGEVMFQPTKLLLDGVDFAPNSPAMATYGREILVAEASVTPVEKKKEVLTQVDEITLEAVRAKPAIVEEIEKPLLKRLNQEVEKNKTLTAENQTLKEAATRSELNTYVADMASKHPKKDDVLKLFMEIAAGCATKEEFSAKVLPYFVDVAAGTKAVEPSATLEERMRKLFPKTPSIHLVEEETTEDSEIDDKVERVGALEVPG